MDIIKAINGRPLYYRLKGHTPVPIQNDAELYAWYQTRWPQAQVAINRGAWGRLSTVFLTHDHSHGQGEPVLFETMWFPDADTFQEKGCWRWHTWEEAEAGHGRLLAQIEAGEEPTGD